MISMPVAVVAGTIRPSGFTETPSTPRPNAFGIDGPVISASRIAVCFPMLFIFTAISAVTRDFPTPPFPLTTPITFLTLLAGFNCCSSPRRSCSYGYNFRSCKYLLGSAVRSLPRTALKDRIPQIHKKGKPKTALPAQISRFTGKPEKSTANLLFSCSVKRR